MEKQAKAKAKKNMVIMPLLVGLLVLQWPYQAAADWPYACDVEVKPDGHVSWPACNFDGRSSAQEGSLEYAFAWATGACFSVAVSLVLSAVDLSVEAVRLGLSLMVDALEGIWELAEGLLHDHFSKAWVCGVCLGAAILAWPAFIFMHYLGAFAKRNIIQKHPAKWSCLIFVVVALLWFFVWLGLTLLALLSTIIACLLLTLMAGAAMLGLVILVTYIATKVACLWFFFLLLAGTLLGCLIFFTGFLPLALLSVSLLGLLALTVHWKALWADERMRALHRAGWGMRDPKDMSWQEWTQKKAKEGSWVLVNFVARCLEGAVEVIEFMANLSMTNAAFLKFMGMSEWNVFENVEEHIATSVVEALALPLLSRLEPLLIGIEDAAFWMPTAIQDINAQLGIKAFDFQCPGAASLAPCCQLAAGFAIAYFMQTRSELKAVLNRLFSEAERFVLLRPLALVVFFIQQWMLELMVSAGQAVFVFAFRGAPKRQACDYEGDLIMTGITRCVLIVFSIVACVVVPRVALANEHRLGARTGSCLAVLLPISFASSSAVTAGHTLRPIDRIKEFLKESYRLARIIFWMMLGFLTEEGLEHITRSVEDRSWFEEAVPSRRYESYVQLSAQLISVPLQALPLGTLLGKVMQATNAGFVLTNANQPRLPAVDWLARVEKFLSYVKAFMLVAIPLVPEDAKKVLLWIAFAAIIGACVCNHNKQKPELEETVAQGDNFALTEIVQRILDRFCWPAVAVVRHIGSVMSSSIARGLDMYFPRTVNQLKSMKAYVFDFGSLPRETVPTTTSSAAGPPALPAPAAVEPVALGAAEEPGTPASSDHELAAPTPAPESVAAAVVDTPADAGLDPAPPAEGAAEEPGTPAASSDHELAAPTPAPESVAADVVDTPADAGLDPAPPAEGAVRDTSTTATSEIDESAQPAPEQGFDETSRAAADDELVPAPEGSSREVPPDLPPVFTERQEGDGRSGHFLSGRRSCQPRPSAIGTMAGS